MVWRFTVTVKDAPSPRIGGHGSLLVRGDPETGRRHSSNKGDGASRTGRREQNPKKRVGCVVDRGFQKRLSSMRKKAPDAEEVAAWKGDPGDLRAEKKNNNYTEGTPSRRERDHQDLEETRLKKRLTRATIRQEKNRGKPSASQEESWPKVPKKVLTSPHGEKGAETWDAKQKMTGGRKVKSRLRARRKKRRFVKTEQQRDR